MSLTSHRLTWFALSLLALLVAVALIATKPNIAFAQEDNVDALYSKGLAEFKQGYYGYNENVEGHPFGALYYFERVKRAIGNLGDDEKKRKVNLMIQEASFAVLLRMARAEHHDDKVQAEIRGFARWLMSQSQRGQIDDTARDVKSIQNALLRAMRDHRAEERLRWMDAISAKHGEFAVPEIHRLYLHCGDEELMGRAMFLLTRIGRPAVLPLIEVLDSNIKEDIRNACHVLGDLGDTRAIPALLKVYENKAMSGDVVAEAADALTKLGWPLKTTGDKPQASLMFYQQALKYFYQVPEMMFGHNDMFVIWRWVQRVPGKPDKGGFLDYDHHIPMWAFMDILAEEACLDALVLNDNYAEAWDLLVNINLRQHLEAKARMQYSTDEEKAAYAALFKRSHRGVVLAGPAGQQALLRAVRRALADRQPEVCVGAIEKLMEVGDDRYIPKVEDFDTTGNILDNPPGRRAEVELGLALIEALTSEDKRVRYAAARAMFSLNNNRISNFKPFYGMETARDVLIQGLGESAQRTILVITPNLDLRNDLRKRLDDLGYYVYFAESPTDGVARALSFPNDDLILIDVSVANTPIRTQTVQRDEFRAADVERSQTIIDILKDDFRTKDIPLVLMADPEKDKEEDVRDRFKAEYGSNKLQSHILKLRGNKIDAVEADLSVFKEVWKKKQNDAKDRANQIAIKCAEAVRTWDPDLKPDESAFFTPVIQALVARANDPRKNVDVKVAMLQTLEQFCQAKKEDKYPVKFWNDEVIPNMRPILNSAAEIDEPIVKYWACKVLVAVYLNRRQGAEWTSANFNPFGDDAKDRIANTFWALVELLDYDPPVVGLDAKPENEKATWEKQWERDVQMVREAAGEVMGAAPMTAQQRLYVYMYKRINRKDAVNYKDLLGK